MPYSYQGEQWNKQSPLKSIIIILYTLPLIPLAVFIIISISKQIYLERWWFRLLKVTELWAERELFLYDIALQRECILSYFILIFCGVFHYFKELHHNGEERCLGHFRCLILIIFHLPVMSFVLLYRITRKKTSLPQAPSHQQPHKVILTCYHVASTSSIDVHT